MKLLLQQIGCSDELGLDLECLRRVCSLELGPDGKLVLIAALLGEQGLLPIPWGKGFERVECEDRGDEVVIRVYAEDGVYGLACRALGARRYCYPLPCTND